MPIQEEKPPPIRQDLEFLPQYYRGDLCYIARDPVTLEYFRLEELEYVVLRCFQDGLGVEQTQRRVKERLGVELSEYEIYKFANQLQQSNLLKSKGMADVRRIAERQERERKNKIKRFVSNYLFITIPIWDPDKLLEKLLPVFRFFYRPVSFVIWAILAGVAAYIIVTNFSTLIDDAFSLLSGWNLLILSCVVFSVKFFHELGHAFTCKHYGGEVHAIGPAFLVFQPCMFTDASDAWTFPSKWHRMAVTGAGVFTEILLASVAAIVWLTSDPGFLKQLSYTTMIVCTVYTLLFNANPLLRFDGYYMLSDLLEIPNLRQKSATYLQYLFDRYALGLQRDPPAVQNADPHTLTIYGVLRVCYRLFIVLSIGFFLYSIFEPLGVVMWVTSLYGMFFMPLYRHAKQLARHYRSGGLQIKYTILMAVVIGLFAAGWFFPIDYTIEAPCVVAPARISVIRAPFEAIVEKVFVSEGEMVEEGDPLIRISRPELEIRCHQLRALIEETEGRMRFALGRQPAVYAMELREKKKLQEELGKLREDIERLTLRASHDGRIINVHNAEVKASFGRHGFVPFPRKDVPLALNDFQGMTVSPGTGLVAVADTSGYRFESYVYEYNLSDISIGDPIFSVVRGIPEMVYESRVKDISAVDVRSIENIGITLADVGYIPVEPDESGEKKPLVTLYKVRSRLLSKGTSEAGQSATTGKGQLEVGMTGKARIQYGRGPMGRYFFKRILMGLRLRLQKVS